MTGLQIYLYFEHIKYINGRFLLFWTMYLFGNIWHISLTCTYMQYIHIFLIQTNGMYIDNAIKKNISYHSSRVPVSSYYHYFCLCPHLFQNKLYSIHKYYFIQIITYRHIFFLHFSHLLLTYSFHSELVHIKFWVASLYFYWVWNICFVFLMSVCVYVEVN